MTPDDHSKPVKRAPLTLVPREDLMTGASRISGLGAIDSRDLLAGQSIVLIHHLGEIYRLQTTRQGKLILTK
jgi:hemin uptake protein HemP